MNQELLQRLIERAMTDEDFQQMLLTDSDSVLIEWGFSAEEVAELESLIEQGTPLEELGERLSKYLFGGAGPGGRVGLG